jgi:hypothetical protein
LLIILKGTFFLKILKTAYLNFLEKFENEAINTNYIFQHKLFDATPLFSNYSRLTHDIPCAGVATLLESTPGSSTSFWKTATERGILANKQKKIVELRGSFLHKEGDTGIISPDTHI